MRTSHRNLAILFFIFGAGLFSVSAYIYWPLWQELRGRAVDHAMTLQTEEAIGNGNVDPVYTKLANATGGSVCYAGGNSPEEKNQNLQKCMAAIAHRDLLRNKETLTRDRFTKVKNSLFRWQFPLLFAAYLVFFLTLNSWILSTRWAFSVACAMPPFVFWLLIGRGENFPLPLYATFFSLVLSSVTFRFFLAPDSSRSIKNFAAVVCVLIGLIPCAFILLLAGVC